jgi:hypothetical protein
MTEHERKLVKSRRVEKAISRLGRMRLIYKWGGARVGNHIAEPVAAGLPWTDCSGFGLYLAAVADLHPENPVGSTFSMATEGREGTSDYFTWFIKNEPASDAHVIVRLRKRPRPWHRGQPRYRWAECGGSDNPSAGGGPHWFQPSAARIAEFPIRRHFPEL